MSNQVNAPIVFLNFYTISLSISKQFVVGHEISSWSTECANDCKPSMRFSCVALSRCWFFTWMKTSAFCSNADFQNFAGVCTSFRGQLSFCANESSWGHAAVLGDLRSKSNINTSDCNAHGLRTVRFWYLFYLKDFLRPCRVRRELEPARLAGDWSRKRRPITMLVSTVVACRLTALLIYDWSYTTAGCGQRLREHRNIVSCWMQHCCCMAQKRWKIENDVAAHVVVHCSTHHDLIRSTSDLATSRLSVGKF